MPHLEIFFPIKIYQRVVKIAGKEMLPEMLIGTKVLAFHTKCFAFINVGIHNFEK